MKLSEYKEGDKVFALINNPKLNDEIWVAGDVVKTGLIHQRKGKPYPCVHVKLIRTYCTAEPNFNWLENGVKLFTHNTLSYYTKENTEMFVYPKQIKLR